MIVPGPRKNTRKRSRRRMPTSKPRRAPAKSKSSKCKRKECRLEIRIGDRGASLRHSVIVPVGVQNNMLSPKRTGRRVLSVLATTLAAAGHSARLRILDLLLAGPATYRALQRCTGCKVGPLYHHVHHLRLAGLILP